VRHKCKEIQTSLFNFIETNNSSTKEEFSEFINPKEVTNPDLSDFKQKLTKAINFDPRKDK